MPDPTPEEIARIAEGLSEQERRAYLTAGKRIRALDPESLFITDTRGCGRLLGTTVTMAGLMLTPLGCALRALAQEQGDA